MYLNFYIKLNILKKIKRNSKLCLLYCINISCAAKIYEIINYNTKIIQLKYVKLLKKKMFTR